MLCHDLTDTAKRYGPQRAHQLAAYSYLVNLLQDLCKFVLQSMETEKGIYLGEFVKAMLKVCNIAAELEKVCELFNDLELLSIIKQIPELVMKFVVTNQSLYV